MNKLSKEKRNQLILVILITVVGVAGLWLGLINFQKQYLQDLAFRKEAARKKVAEVEQKIKSADQIESDLAVKSKKLAEMEDDMASGDLYSWMVNNIRRFKLPYKIDLPQFSLPEVKEMTLRSEERRVGREC